MNSLYDTNAQNIFMSYINTKKQKTLQAKELTKSRLTTLEIS